MLNHVPPAATRTSRSACGTTSAPRTTCIQFVIQRKPTVWMDGGWDAKFGLDSKSQGTGFTDDEARDFRINGVADFRQYMFDVFRTTEDYVAA